ncbi:hypothetical protein V1477_006798 [Vespula maculifrons]|uniref:Uncharacterized protein n=1 Tax=Vespula maculifrons TaxID=7453 RepID=A0ABD2CGX0_VESMC
MQGGRSNVQSENPPRIELVSPFTTDLWHPRPFPFTEVTPSQPNSGKDLHFLPFKLHQQRLHRSDFLFHCSRNFETSSCREIRNKTKIFLQR